MLAESEQDALLDGGLRITRPDGWATLDADARAAEVTVCAEAADMETARELCGFYLEKFREALRAQQERAPERRKAAARARRNDGRPRAGMAVRRCFPSAGGRPGFQAVVFPFVRG